MGRPSLHGARLAPLAGMRLLALLLIAVGCAPEQPEISDWAGPDLQTPVDGRDYPGVVSEDGSQVAYIHLTAGEAQLRVRARDGREDRVVAELPRYLGLQSLYAYQRARGYFLLFQDTVPVLLRPTQLVGFPGSFSEDCLAARVVPSPDGERIAVVSACRGAFEVVMYDDNLVELGRIRQSAPERQLVSPLWTPVGTLIVNAGPGPSWEIGRDGHTSRITVTPRCFEPATASHLEGPGSYLDCQPVL
jgi:hypothetical protein